MFVAHRTMLRHFKTSKTKSANWKEFQPLAWRNTVYNCTYNTIWNDMNLIAVAILPK